MKKEFNILIVDDDIDEHFLIQTAIKEVDYKIHVLSVYNGVQGIDYLLKKGSYSNEEHVTPDIILTDLNMPLCNGIEFLRELKSHDSLKHIRVVVMSTSSDSKTKETCLSLGASEYIIKPIMTSVYAGIIKGMISNYLLKSDITPV
ncbi:MAG: response regulator receiver protein [Bacteroidetes bacterium]|nr:response regulator receiver protein [Bacteroidota bacterium]